MEVQYNTEATKCVMQTHQQLQYGYQSHSSRTKRVIVN